MTLTLHECSIEDLETLCKISRQTFTSAFRSQNEPANFEAYVDNAFNVKTMRSQLENVCSNFYFVYEKDVLVGYFKLNEKKAQTDINDEESMELERIYVLEGHQGKNIGTWMLQQTIYISKEAKKTYLWLGVWEHNPRAIQFYERHGFRKFGTHPYYLGKDKQTDWLLRLELQ